MAIKTIDIDGGKGVLFVGRGLVTDKEFVDIYKAHLTQNEKKFSRYRYSLSDFEGIKDTDIKSESIEYIANLCENASRINPHPIVAWAAKETLIYGLSRMVEILMSGTNWETMVFKSRADAVQWIRKRVKEKFNFDNIGLK
jgi:hypothetical protein